MEELLARMMRAAKLDVQVYEEVEADQGATWQAASVVVLSSVAAALGVANMPGNPGVFVVTVGALIGWVCWAGVIYLIGGKLLPEPQTEVDVSQLMRTLGFAQAPGVLRVLGLVPLIGPLIATVASVWMIVAMVVAVRQALDYKSTGRAIAVCVLGFIAYGIVITAILGLLVGSAS